MYTMGKIIHLYKTLPGILSIFWSLYLIPNEYADEDWLTFFSDFSTSYDPGAVMNKHTKA